MCECGLSSCPWTPLVPLMALAALGTNRAFRHLYPSRLDLIKITTIASCVEPSLCLVAFVLTGLIPAEDSVASAKDNAVEEFQKIVHQSEHFAELIGLACVVALHQRQSSDIP